ncbi:hypothetical protein FB45DRAFT_1051129 [Roridomyces roridus]|uniref:BTB domain-containing protein n=1 Tax=Roridomyces roridus TaxID=1738132 RepID=A0AAD7CL74_9AGAR|nr:hypothetical protein FB45DRAFT_1051129 [Roridomyces roridus]
MDFDSQIDAAGCKLNAFRPGTVDVIVEGNQYTIDRFFLERDSPVLRELFAELREGDPVYALSGATKAELEHLLWVYYKTSIARDPWAPITVWKDILKLADMWKMEQIKDHALGHLRRGKMDAMEKIKHCEREDVPTYEAKEAYMELCTRTEPLTAADFQVLGMDIGLRIMQIRERILASRVPQAGIKPQSEGEIVDDVIGRAPPPTVLASEMGAEFDLYC